MQNGRIIVVDKSPAALGGIRRLLESEAETVLMVGDEASLRDALARYLPDAVLIDLAFVLSSKSAVVRQIKSGCPGVKVIVLSLDDERSVVDNVMASGVEGFVLKRRAVIDLVPALREVLLGRTYVSPDVNEAL